AGSDWPGLSEQRDDGSDLRWMRGTGPSPLDAVVFPPEPGDLLDHRGRVANQPIPVTSVVAPRIVSGRLVQPVRGLIRLEDGSQRLLGHEQVHAMDDAK